MTREAERFSDLLKRKALAERCKRKALNAKRGLRPPFLFLLARSPLLLLGLVCHAELLRVLLVELHGRVCHVGFLG